MEKSYLEMRLPTAGFDEDLLAGILQNAGTMGILEQSDHEWIAYFPGEWTPEHFSELIRRLQKINPHMKMESVRTRNKPYRDWNREWQKYFVPFEVVEGVWIRPVWEPLPSGAHGLELVLKPGMAFGTGHHETTRLIISFLQARQLSGKSVLDLGCGSAVLSILAAKLNAVKVVGVDIDAEALENARENIRLNAVTNIELIHGGITEVPSRRFELILANINRNVLETLPAAFRQHITHGGELILSGILHTDVPEIDRKYSAAGFKLKKKEEAGEWAGLMYTL